MCWWKSLARWRNSPLRPGRTTCCGRGWTRTTVAMARSARTADPSVRVRDRDTKLRPGRVAAYHFHLAAMAHRQFATDHQAKPAAARRQVRLFAVEVVADEGRQARPIIFHHQNRAPRFASPSHADQIGPGL